MSSPQTQTRKSAGAVAGAVATRRKSVKERQTELRQQGVKAQEKVRHLRAERQRDVNLAVQQRRRQRLLAQLGETHTSSEQTHSNKLSSETSSESSSESSSEDDDPLTSHKPWRDAKERPAHGADADWVKLTSEPKPFIF